VGGAPEEPPVTTAADQPAPRRPRRPRWPLAVALLGALALPAVARADAAADLAAKYAPVVRIVEQSEPCGHGEPYVPADVDAVLGNAEVALRGPWDTTNVVKVAPTADDLAKGLDGYHLDFPGAALDPGCTYDEWSHRLAATSPPTMYARVATEPGKPGRLALQYWFFYVFNDFNNKHEGDWEMAQVVFPASTPEQALQRTPIEIGYSQHDGAERAAWGANKLTVLEATHPVVYPALGSHANYFTPALFLGRSAAQGVGCDDTNGPSRDLRPTLRVIPSDPAAATAAFPWLAYQGKWGERHSAFYDGPGGPNTNDKWKAPLTWTDTSWRDESYAVPAGASLGPTATDFFCGAVAAGSNVLTRFVADPTPVLIVLGGLIALLLWLASRTTWSQSAPFRVRRRRPWGSLLTTSFRLYWSRPRLFLGLGVLFIPLGLLITLVQYLIFRLGELAPLVDRAGPSNAFVATLAFALGLFMTIFGLTIVQAATAVVVDELDAGREIRPLEAYHRVRARWRPLVRSLLGAVLAIGALEFVVLGFAIGIWLSFRWSLLGQVVMLEDDPQPGVLRRSGRLVGPHWWRTASIGVLVTGLGLLLGPLVGLVLLFITTASFDAINLVSGFVYAVTLPYVAITTTYLYHDLAVRQTMRETQVVAGDVLPAEA
jgi:hypothetical protein